MLNKILIIGGDSRQQYMADYFESCNYQVSVYGLAETKRKCVTDIKIAVKDSDIIIFPLPITKDGKSLCSKVTVKEPLDSLIQPIDNKHLVFGGMINTGTFGKLKKKTEKVYDYFKIEEVTVKNTVPTVQGIIKTIIDNIDYTIASSKCAVFGYGRVAKITADTLKALGADVTVCARKPSDIASAEIKGMKSCFIKDFSKKAADFDIIINTVPSIIITREILEKLKSDCIIIDVASAPYGTDFAAAYELGIKAMQCPSLPGKVAPKTAGKIIADAILKIIEEEENG